MDYMRGAARQVRPAVERMRQSGQESSANADLIKAISGLVKLIQQQPAAQPAQRVEPTLTLSSFLQHVEGDQLNEGAWDFVKGAGRAVKQKIQDQIKAYGDRPSFLKDVVNSGMQAHRAGSAQASSQRIPNQVKIIQQILQRIPGANQGVILRNAVASSVSGTGVPMADIMKMIVPPAQPAAQTPAARTPAARTPAAPLTLAPMTPRPPSRNQRGQYVKQAAPW